MAVIIKALFMPFFVQCPCFLPVLHSSFASSSQVVSFFVSPTYYWSTLKAYSLSLNLIYFLIVLWLPFLHVYTYSWNTVSLVHTLHSLPHCCLRYLLVFFKYLSYFPFIFFLLLHTCFLLYSVKCVTQNVQIHVCFIYYITSVVRINNGPRESVW